MLEATQAGLDFTQDAVAPAPAPQDAPGGDADTFVVGEAVYLRGARFGLPGRVLRLERGRAVIYWRDLDHISRHKPCTLILAESGAGGEQNAGPR
jgi:hypothetical protein